MNDVTLALILTSMLNTQKIILAAEASRVGLYNEEEYKKFLTDAIRTIPKSKDAFDVLQGK